MGWIIVLIGLGGFIIFLLRSIVVLRISVFICLILNIFWGVGVVSSTRVEIQSLRMNGCLMLRRRRNLLLGGPLRSILPLL